MQKAGAELFRALEQSLMHPEVRSSPARLDALLDDDFVEFGRSGKTYDKATVLQSLAAEPQISSQNPPELADFAASLISEDVVLVTYRISGQSGETDTLRSSLWVLRSGTWHMRFHQGTPTSSD